MLFLYGFLKFNGLIPFHLDIRKLKASLSRSSVVYSLAYTLILFSYTVTYMYQACTIIFDDNVDRLLAVILAIGSVMAAFKTLVLYLIQIVQRHKIIDSINLLCKLCKLAFNKEVLCIDSTLMGFCKGKCWTLVAQIFLLSITFGFYEYNWSSYYTINNFIIIVYSHSTTTIGCSVFFYGCMLCSARLYKFLNQKMEELRELSKGTSYSQNKDIQLLTLDEITFLYQQTTAFTEKLCLIHSFQIIFSLTGIIVWSLTPVRSNCISK